MIQIKLSMLSHSVQMWAKDMALRLGSHQMWKHHGTAATRQPLRVAAISVSERCRTRKSRSALTLFRNVPEATVHSALICAKSVLAFKCRSLTGDKTKPQKSRTAALPAPVGYPP